MGDGPGGAVATGLRWSVQQRREGFFFFFLCFVFCHFNALLERIVRFESKVRNREGGRTCVKGPRAGIKPGPLL